MKQLIGIIALVMTASAAAQTIGAGAISGSESNANSSSIAGANAGATSGSSSAVNATQGQGQEQTNRQGQSQGQSANNRQGQGQGQAQEANNANIVSPNQSITFNSTTPAATSQSIQYSGTTTQRFAPAVVGAVMPPSAVCMATYSAGGSGIGFGINIGISSLDKECERRETARTLQALGASEAAIAVMCGNDVVKASAPAMCKRVMALMDPPAAGNLPAPTPPGTATPPIAPTPAPKTSSSSTGPQVGQIEKGSDGRAYRFTGLGWQPIVDEAPAPAAKANSASLNEAMPQRVAYTGGPSK